MKFYEFGRDLTIYRRPDTPSNPIVSVILPTYARGHGPLQHAIDSVLSQSYSDFELIIVDDGSRDGSANVLAKYLARDPRIIVHSYAANSGLPALRVNQAALQAKGKYIAYQFDDDIWLDDSLLVRVNALDRQNRPSVAYGNAELKIHFDDRPTIERTLGGPFNYALLCNGNYIANNTVIHHRELFDIVGMYDPHVWVRRFSDYDLWLRFGQVADFIWVDAPVSRVNANLDHSLGKDVGWDFSTLRKIVGTNRSNATKPTNIANYDVISDELFTGALSESERYTLQKSQTIPYLARFNDYCTTSKLLVSDHKRRRKTRLLTTKPDYSTSIDVTIQNFSTIPHQDTISNTFAKESDLSGINPEAFDIALLYRTVGIASEKFLKKNLTRLPCSYLMDDNMLHFHEVGPEQNFLAPGTEMHLRITRQIRDADACIGYSDVIVDDLAEINPRTIRLNTNIPLRYVERRDYSRGARLRIAILSGSVRRGILKELWPAIQAFASEYRGDIELHIWGIDPNEFEALPCPVFSKPFTHSYQLYLNNLLDSSYDVLLVPLDASTRAARSKSPVKLLEAVACGAICIFTDATPYAELPDDCCIKVSNTLDGWSEGLKQALYMRQEGRSAMLETARSLVQRKYSTEGQFFDFLGACDAIRLHARLREKCIAYAFHETALGGATLHLLKHASMARSYGFRVLGIVPHNPKYATAFRDRWQTATGGAPLHEERWLSGYIGGANGQSCHRPINSSDEQDAARIASRLSIHNVGLLHFATWSPTMPAAGARLGVPVVASVHQFYSGDITASAESVHAIHCSSLAYADRWANALKAPARRMVCAVDNDYFDSYNENTRRLREQKGTLKILVSGTLQPRKNQLAAVEALAALHQRGFDVSMDLIGYDTFYPDYVEQCRSLSRTTGISDRVRIHGFIDDPKPFYDCADLLLISANDESMPQTMLQAMAAGVPVIATKVGGIGEIIKHRYSGILSASDSAEDIATAITSYLQLDNNHRAEMVWRANRSMLLLARPSYIRAELMDLYNEAYENFVSKAPITKDSEGTKTQADVNTLLKSLADIHAQLRQLNQGILESLSGE